MRKRITIISLLALLTLGTFSCSDQFEEATEESIIELPGTDNEEEDEETPGNCTDCSSTAG